MDEEVVAEVDADMGEGAAHGVEEHQVAGLQFVLVDDLAGLADLARTARQVEAEAFLENVADEAGAVEAGFGAAAAALVADSDEVERLLERVLYVSGGAVDESDGLLRRGRRRKPCFRGSRSAA
jgi:hypothetical protein